MGIETYYAAFDEEELVDQQFDDDFVELLLARKQSSIDKMWEVLHYILTGNSEADDTPLGMSILGGDEIGPELDYGPARLISSDRVKTISSALDQVDFTERLKVIDTSTEALESVYLGKEIFEEGFDGLDEWFTELKRIYSKAAKSNQVLVCYLA